MGMRRDAAWLKRQRIQSIHNMLKGVGDASLTLFLSNCEYVHGLDPKTTRRYLKVLETLGHIVVDENADLVREVVVEARLPEPDEKEDV